MEYSWKIPPKVKTVDDLNPVDEPQPSKVPANATIDPKRIDKLRKIIDSVTKVGTTFAIAKATVGGIKSIYGNTKDSINNISDTAAKLGNKFADLKANLSKDAINGKISALGALKNKIANFTTKMKLKISARKGAYFTKSTVS